ncbi:MAG TPA: TIGR03619 family F420-dependent LLM class oxidoreductase [Pseudomonadales bacterium]
MKLAVTLRNMGPQSTREIMLAGARRAESLGFESVWITDHIAITPDDSEGSDGRYTDPLTTLAWLAGATTSIKLGVGVLVVPYRPPLPTAKAIATVQELSGNRLLLGLGVGWMDAEFRALGLNRHLRGRQTDAALEFLEMCFSSDRVTSNGQEFLFRPRPAPPPIYIGGRAPHALRRAIRFGHGWLPMARDPESLGRDLKTYGVLAREAGKQPGPVTALAGLPLDAPDRARAAISAYEALGIERLVCAARYRTLEEYESWLGMLAALRSDD